MHSRPFQRNISTFQDTFFSPSLSPATWFLRPLQSFACPLPTAKYAALTGRLPNVSLHMRRVVAIHHVTYSSSPPSPPPHQRRNFAAPRRAPPTRRWAPIWPPVVTALAKLELDRRRQTTIPALTKGTAIGFARFNSRSSALTWSDIVLVDNSLRSIPVVRADVDRNRFDRNQPHDHFRRHVTGSWFLQDEHCDVLTLAQKFTASLITTWITRMSHCYAWIITLKVPVEGYQGYCSCCILVMALDLQKTGSCSDSDVGGLTLETPGQQ